VLAFKRLLKEEGRGAGVLKIIEGGGKGCWRFKDY
jgi:hypothetical protein